MVACLAVIVAMFSPPPSLHPFSPSFLLPLFREGVREEFLRLREREGETEIETNA